MIRKLKAHAPYFVRGDMDGFFGLFIDNLLQLMLLALLCQSACGIPSHFVLGSILPGVAFSIFIGNIFYSWQARKLAQSRGAPGSVTALPFGINTVSMLAYIYLVMSPVYYDTGDWTRAWKAGLAACFLSGIIETLGAFVGDWIKSHTPRAALLSALAGVALSFMSLGFMIQIFSFPSVGFVPMMLVIVVYARGLKFPLRIPGGLLAVAIGTASFWGLKYIGLIKAPAAVAALPVAFHLPLPFIRDLLSALVSREGWTYISVVLPIALFNVISSIQNLESAEAAGDSFHTRSSLLMNGISSLLASALGSPFPTTIYIGHPGWKAMGAREGYSAMSGILIMAVCLTGGVSALLRFVPLEAAMGILIWVGLVIVSEAFHQTNRRHSVAVVVGLLPCLAAWVLHIVETTLRVAGTNLYEMFDRFGGSFHIHGVISLYQGFLLIGTVLSAIIANAVDGKYRTAAIWSFVGAIFSFIGLIHAYQLTPSGIQNYFAWMAAPSYTLVYTALGLFLYSLHFIKRHQS